MREIHKGCEAMPYIFCEGNTRGVGLCHTSFVSLLPSMIAKEAN